MVSAQEQRSEGPGGAAAAASGAGRERGRRAPSTPGPVAETDPAAQGDQREAAGGAAGSAQGRGAAGHLSAKREVTQVLRSGHGFPDVVPHAASRVGRPKTVREAGAWLWKTVSRPPPPQDPKARECHLVIVPEPWRALASCRWLRSHPARTSKSQGWDLRLSQEKAPRLPRETPAPGPRCPAADATQPALPSSSTSGRLATWRPRCSRGPSWV